MCSTFDVNDQFQAKIQRRLHVFMFRVEVKVNYAQHQGETA
jgi:hypothetical protein